MIKRNKLKYRGVVFGRNSKKRPFLPAAQIDSFVSIVNENDIHSTNSTHLKRMIDIDINKNKQVQLSEGRSVLFRFEIVSPHFQMPQFPR